MSEELHKLEGMTVNERLFALGLLDEFDDARARRDVESLRSIFARIGLPDYPVESLLT